MFRRAVVRIWRPPFAFSSKLITFVQSMYLHWHVEFITLSPLVSKGERVFATILLLFCYL